MASFYHRVLRQLDGELHEFLIHPDAVDKDTATLELIDAGSTMVGSLQFTLTDGLVGFVPGAARGERDARRSTHVSAPHRL